MVPSCNDSWALRLVACAALVLLCVSCAGRPRYRDDMNAWIGASRDEWVQAWGLPQHQNDVVEVEPNSIVYSYRSMTCVVSVTFVNDVVEGWRYRGEHCPRVRRPEPRP